MAASRQKPEVCVVIPSVDRWSFVLRAVECSLAQRDVEVQVVVVSDGGTEPPPPSPLLDDERVEVHRRPALLGVCNGRNLGLARSRAPWTAFLDDDDVWAPDKLRLQLAALADAGGDFAYTSAHMLDADLGIVRTEDAPALEDLPVLATRANPLPAGASNLLARTALLRDLGGFDETLMHFGDWDVELRLILAARPAVVREPLVGYVHHDANMHHRQLQGIEREVRRFVAKHAEAGVAIDTTLTDRWIALGYRRAGRRLPAARSYLRSAVHGRSAADVARAGGTLLGERAMLAGRRKHAVRPARRPAWVTSKRAA